MKFTRLIPAAIIIAGLAIGSAIDRAFPTNQEVLDRSFVQEAEVGQTISLRSAEVTVREVDVASTVSNQGREFASAGVWLIVDVEISARGRAFSPTGWQLRSDSGRTYGEFGDLGAVCLGAQPGISQSCRTAFEVSPDDLTGLTLLIPAGGLPAPASDDVAAVSLGDLTGVELTSQVLLRPAFFEAD